MVLKKILKMKEYIVPLGGTVVALFSFLYMLRMICRKGKHKGFHGKVVLITGASSGLGEACAEAFYRAGAKVILAARRVGELERVAKELESLQDVDNAHKPAVIQLDLEDLGNIPTVAGNILELYGKIDILINNGGISYRGHAEHTSLAVDIKVMTTNYFGQIALIKAILPSMIERNEGNIVGISSIQGKLALPFRSPYAASKHALQAFLDSLRAEVNQNVKILTVCPGYICTNLSVNAVTGDGSLHGEHDQHQLTGMKPSYVANKILDAIERGDHEIVLAPLLHRLAILIRTLWPNLYFKIMLGRAQTQRAEMSKEK